MAAVEFAMVLPAMLALVFGSIEVTNALVCKGDVTSTASTAGDLIAQGTKVTDADLNNVYASLAALLYPYPTGSTQVRITSILEAGREALDQADGAIGGAEQQCAGIGRDRPARERRVVPGVADPGAGLAVGA